MRWSCLVVRRGDGSIDFLGRVDAQLSVGGVRIEPSEIEQALSSIGGVSACLVGLNGRQLIAWVETTGVSFEGSAADGSAIGPHTDFFDAGGDSLRAVAVVSMLENEFGQRVAIGELMDAPTPARLAQRLGAESDDDIAVADAERAHDIADIVDTAERAVRRKSGDENTLVEWLRSSGSQTPLVVLPPGGGNLLRYALEALDTAVPHGPYRLLGWSTGGLLAWEIARLLKARGDEVELVVLVDTVMAGLKVDDTGTIAEKYRDMLQDDGVKAVATEGAKRLRERASFAIARRRYRNARESGETPTMEDAERQLGPVIRKAALQYRPKPLDVPVVYVGASESDNAVTLDPWTEVQDGKPFDVIEVEGVHFLPEDRCIIGRNKAADLVEQLSEYFDELSG